MIRARAPRPAEPRAAAGFTMVEVAIALGVAAAALAVMLQVLGEGGARADRAAATRLALMVAQSALAGAGVEGPLEAGAGWSGASAGLAWRVAVSEWSDAPAARDAPPALLVVASVGAPGGAELARLATIRLAPPPPAPASESRPGEERRRAR